MINRVINTNEASICKSDNLLNDTNKRVFIKICENKLQENINNKENINNLKQCIK